MINGDSSEKNKEDDGRSYRGHVVPYVIATLQGLQLSHFVTDLEELTFGTEGFRILEKG